MQRVVPFAGGTVAILDEGQGVPWVLVHSSGMTKRQWSGLLPLLTAQGRAVALDLLGNGDSSPPCVPYTRGQDVAALRAVLDSLPARAHVVGHSFGGRIVLDALAQRPDGVRSVCLYEPVAFGVLSMRTDSDDVQHLRRLDDRIVRRKQEHGAAWQEDLVAFWNGAGAWERLPSSMRQTLLAAEPTMWLESETLVGDVLPIDTWSSVAVPTLIVTGAQSPDIAHRMCHRLASGFSSGRCVVMPGAGHMGPLTHPQRFAEILRAHAQAAG